MLLALLLAAPTPASAQEADPPMTKALSLGGVGGVYAGVGTWAFFAWYDRPPEHGFRFNEDGWFGRDTYAGGADKLGHLWSNLALTRVSADVLEAGGWSPRQATWIGASLTTAFFTAVEIKDGYYYAFSWGDMAANMLGTALAVTFRELPEVDELVDVRVSYWPSPAYRAQGGLNFAEDYSGQTYLLAFHLAPWLPEDGYGLAGRYVDVVLGYRALNYKPARDAGHAKRREPFVGLSLNLGQLLGDALFDGRTDGTVGAVTEHVNLPFTAVPVAPPASPR